MNEVMEDRLKDAFTSGQQECADDIQFLVFTCQGLLLAQYELVVHESQNLKHVVRYHRQVTGACFQPGPVTQASSFVGLLRPAS